VPRWLDNIYIFLARPPVMDTTCSSLVLFGIISFRTCSRVLDLRDNRVRQQYTRQIVRHSHILMKVNLDKHGRFLSHCIRIDRIPASISDTYNPVQLVTYLLVRRSVSAGGGLNCEDAPVMFWAGGHRKVVREK